MSGRKIILGINDDTTLHGGDGDDHFIAWGDFNKAKQTFVNDPKRDVKFYGNGGNDKLVGAGGNDFLDGGSGDDTIFGYDGNDKIITGSGEDFVNAGNGDDEIIVNGAGLKHLYGGKGSDKFILNYMNLDSGIIINDFDLNDPNEVIDLRAIKSLHSIKDFHQVFHHDMPLQHSSDPDLYRTDSRPEGMYQAVCLSSVKAEEAPNECWVALMGITKDQILSHPEKFLFSEMHDEL
jgi:Ca2+-binding RTX toxin-like protein